MPVLQHATVDGPEMESARPCMMRPEQQHGHLVARAERAQGMKTMLQQVRHWQAELKLAEPRQALLSERQHLGHSLASSSQPICRGLRRSPPIREVQAEAESQAIPLPGGAQDVLRQQDLISHQRQQQERPTAGDCQAASDVRDQDQGQSGARPMDCTEEADSWSSAEPYCDAVEEQLPPPDEVVELSGDDDSSVVLSDSHAAMQHVDTMASRAQAPAQDNVVSSRGQDNEKASLTLLPQLGRTEGHANPAKETLILAAVTEMVSLSSTSAAASCVCTPADWQREG